jgi:hypothetical protein
MEIALVRKARVEIFRTHAELFAVGNGGQSVGFGRLQ